MAAHGSLTVDARTEAAYEQAKAYVCKDARERVLFFRLEHDPSRHFTLRENARNDDHFDPNSNTIFWDPLSALRTTNGGRQSAALGLAHEVDHAVENPAREQRLASHRLARYDNAEERRVILGSETHAARILGEGTRHDHRGRAYHVATSTALLMA